MKIVLNKKRGALGGTPINYWYPSLINDMEVNYFLYILDEDPPLEPKPEVWLGAILAKLIALENDTNSKYTINIIYTPESKVIEVYTGL